MGEFPATVQTAMVNAMKLPKAARASNELAQKYEKMSAEAKRTARINHLTPKQYGGCPTNLQP